MLNFVSGFSAMARGIFGTGSNFRVGWRKAGAGGGWICVFRDFSAGIGKGFILAGVLGGGLSL